MPDRANTRMTAFLAPMLLLVASTATAQDQSLGDLPPPTDVDRALLQDAIDIHTHLDPDSFGPHSSQARRGLDVIDMAKRAEQAGMRGFVVKQHYDQSAQLAYLANKAVPGVEVFGQLCLNLTVGGLNPAAIYHFGEVKGGRARIVSMPTWDSENYVRSSPNPDRPFVPVSSNGQLLPATQAAITAIASAKIRDSDAQLALATGHVSADEALMVVREAKRQGIERIVVTHAIGHPIDMTMSQMKEAVGLGAYIEFVAGFLVGERASFTVQQYHDAIRSLGPANVILSSDGGQLGRRDMPDELIALVAGQLRAKGFTAAELHQMMVENPAALLGLPQPE